MLLYVAGSSCSVRLSPPRREPERAVRAIAGEFRRRLSVRSWTARPCCAPRLGFWPILEKEEP